MPTPTERDPLTQDVIGLAIDVHRELGPGLLESTYEECLCFELKRTGMALQRQLALPVMYKSMRLDCGYRLDVVIERRLILELKTVERLLPIHEAQMMTYLKLSGITTGLLLNFNSVVLRDGIRRMMTKG
jgi:GxxExxY protein